MIQRRTNINAELLPERLPQDDWRDAWTSPDQTEGRLATPEDAAGKPPIPRRLYKDVKQPFQYGPGDDHSYKLAGLYLSGKGLVEDWGCGTTWARRYIGAPYRGIDAAPTPWADVVTDLTQYNNGGVPKILMRHVLEHNWEWRAVLQNMLNSFTDRAMLLLHLRPGAKDTNMYQTARSSFGALHEEDYYMPGLSLAESDLESIISARAADRGLDVHMEEMQTNIESQYERIYWLEVKR